MSQLPSEVPIQTGKKSSWRGAIRGNVLMMGLVSLFTDFSSEMMNPMLPVFIAGLVPAALAPVFIGLMEGLAETTASLLKIFSGRLSDALGKRKAIVIVGYGLSAIFRPLMALATGGMQVVGMKFADRVGKGIRTSPRDALISDSVGADVRGLAFSFHRAMDHLGAVLGPLVSFGLLYLMLGGVVFDKTGGWETTGQAAEGEVMHSLRWLFALALIPGIAAMVTLIGKVKEIAPKPKAAGADGKTAGGLPGRFYGFVAIVVLFALGNSSDLFIVFYGMKKFGLDLAELIAMWVLLHVSKIIFSFPGGVLSDKLGRRPIIVAGWSMYALVYLGLAVASQAWQFWALVIAYGFYYGCTEGAEKALVADFVPSERRGTAYGVYHGAIGIAALPASLLFGIFWSQIGPVWAFSIGAALAGAAAILLILLLSVKPVKTVVKG